MRAALLGVVLAGVSLAGMTPAASPPSKTAPVAPAGEASSPQHLSHGRFKDVVVYAPVGTPKALVLLLSDRDGWSPGLSRLALALTRRGSLVAGIDTRQLEVDLAADGGDCVFADGDLENLSHFVQAYYHLPSYQPPFLVGAGSGATRPDGSLVQASPNTFAGVITLGFCPTTSLRKPLCKGAGLQFERADQGLRYLPRAACESLGWRCKASRPPSAALGRSAISPRICRVPRWSRCRAMSRPWIAGCRSFSLPSIRCSSERRASSPRPVPAALGNLPVVGGAGESGNAGHGSPRHYPVGRWRLGRSRQGGRSGARRTRHSRRRPRLVALFLDRTHAAEHCSRPRYAGSLLPPALRQETGAAHRLSQGADVLPFAVNRLSPATRPRVALVVLMGMSEHAVFEFHVSNWISDDNSGPATLPR